MTHPQNSPINCPIVSPNLITPCPPRELDPLLEWLGKGGRAVEQHTFPRGTALPDGRLDLCKQSLGIEGTQRVCATLEAHPSGVRHLLLGTNGLGDEGAAALARLIEVRDSLQTVYLGCNAIGESGAAALSQAIIKSEHVQNLWLKRNPLGMGGVRHLAAMLRQNKGLKTLDLTNTGLGTLRQAQEPTLRPFDPSTSSEHRKLRASQADIEPPSTLRPFDKLRNSRDVGTVEMQEPVEVLCEGLQAEQARLTLERLYLGGNGIGKAGAERLATWLGSSPALSALYLSVNHLGDAGTVALAQGLPHSRLRVLSLASNQIGPQAIETLLSSLPPTLQRLDLGYARSTKALGGHPNCLGDEGAIKIAHWLGTNPNLQALDLRGNKLTSKAGLALEAALTHNTHLIELHLGGHVSRKIRRRLRTLLQRNLMTSPMSPPPPELLHIRSVYRTKMN